MTWVRIDDAMPQHPKIAAVGPLGLAMQVAALCYCNRHLTDGFVPWGAARTLLSWEVLGEGGAIWTLSMTSGMAGKDVTTDAVIDALLDAGVWTDADGGYRIHGYAEYQPTKEQVMAARADLSAKRSAAGKRGAASRWQNGKAVASAVAYGCHGDGPDPDPDPKTPPATPSVSSRAREARPSPTTVHPDLEDATLPSAEDAPPSRQDAPGSRFVARTPPDPSSEAKPLSEAPSPPADDRETVCPLDLVERCEAAGIPGDVAARHGCSAEAVRGHVREVRDYWTVGPGAGKRRRHWLQVVRARLHELGRRGDLRDAATLAADEQRRHPGGTPIQPGKADGDLAKYKNVRIIKAVAP